MECDYENKQKKISLNNFILFCIATWMLLFSFLEVRNGNYAIHLGLKILPIVIFAILNASIDIIYYNESTKFYFKAENEVDFKKHLLFRGIILGFFYVAVYNTVLLPFSGFGIVEYIFVAYILMFYLSTYITPTKLNFPTFISSKNSIILLHGCLFLVKIITWVLPENFYRENITGNDTVRTFIAIATFILLCLLLVAGLITVKNKLKIPESAINSAKTISQNASTKVGGLVSSGINNASQIVKNGLKTVITPKIVSIIVLIVIAVIFIAGIFLIYKIRDDMLDLIEPFFMGIFSTGKYTVQLSSLYYVLQVGVCILYTIFLLYKDLSPEDDDINNILMYFKISENETGKVLNDMYKNNSRYREEILHNAEYYKVLVESEDKEISQTNQNI